MIIIKITSYKLRRLLILLLQLLLLLIIIIITPYNNVHGDVFVYHMSNLENHCLLKYQHYITSGTGSMFNPAAMMGGGTSSQSQSGGPTQSGGASSGSTSKILVFIWCGSSNNCQNDLLER